MDDPYHPLFLVAFSYSITNVNKKYNIALDQYFFMPVETTENS